MESYVLIEMLDDNLKKKEWEKVTIGLVDYHLEVSWKYDTAFEISKVFI